MRTVAVNLPDELYEFITAKVRSGLYRSTDEAIQAALRILEEDDAKMVVLRQALEAGLASGVAEAMYSQEFEHERSSRRNRSTHDRCPVFS